MPYGTSTYGTVAYGASQPLEQITPVIPSTPVTRRRRGGGPAGGKPNIIVLPSRKKMDDVAPPYAPPKPIELAEQYELLLASGEISVEEWTALWMVHGLRP